MRHHQNSPPCPKQSGNSCPRLRLRFVTDAHSHRLGVRLVLGLNCRSSGAQLVDRCPHEVWKLFPFEGSLVSVKVGHVMDTVRQILRYRIRYRISGKLA